MHWKDKAREAADKKAAQERDAQQQKEAIERATQLEAFGFALRELLGEDIPVEDFHVTIDGVTFGWVPTHVAMPLEYQRYHMVMLGTCPQCGETARSTALRNLEDVGQQLREFRPGDDHVKAHLMSPKVKDVGRTTPISRTP